MQNQPTNLRTAERASQTRPAYLYHFVHGASHYWLTNYDANIVTTGAVAQTWTSGQVAHDLGEGSAELSKRQATVALGILDSEFRRYFLTAPPQRATIEIYRVNCDPSVAFDFAANAYMEFSGVALGPSFGDTAIGIEFASELAQEDRSILRFAYQPQCNHVIYGKGCFVSRDAHKITKTVSLANRANRYIECQISTVPDASGGTTAVTAQSFEGGYLLEVATGNQVGIVSASLLGGGIVRLFLQWWPATILAGVSVTLFKGCRHTVAGCREDFDNLAGQEGIISGLTQTGIHVVGLVPAPWVYFANRTEVCVPKYNGVDQHWNSIQASSDWAINVPVDFGAGAVNLGANIIVFLRKTLSGSDAAKLPRLGGFGGHPYIPVNNPATDGYG